MEVPYEVPVQGIFVEDPEQDLSLQINVRCLCTKVLGLEISIQSLSFEDALVALQASEFEL